MLKGDELNIVRVCPFFSRTFTLSAVKLLLKSFSAACVKYTKAVLLHGIYT